MGAEVVWEQDRVRSAVLGAALLLIVASLAELNRRYTWSYRCACRAAKLNDAKEAGEWQEFVTWNEAWWSPDLPVDAGKTPQVGPIAWRRTIAATWNRFFLSWSTYLPGVLAGLYLVRRDGRGWEKVAAWIAVFIMIAVWLKRALSVARGRPALPAEAGKESLPYTAAPADQKAPLSVAEQQPVAADTATKK